MNEKAPLFSGVVAYAKQRVLPFHTPGHKLHSDLFLEIKEVFGDLFCYDASDEVHSIDLGHDFDTALEKAEDLAAKTFGAKRTFFLTHGTTLGLQSMLLTLAGTVLIPRFSHQAIYSGLTLSHAKPHYLPLKWDETWQIPLSPSVEEFSQVLATEKPEALVVTHPNYYGNVTDLRALVTQAKPHGVMVLVDEAHGAHFSFSKDLPPSAMECGACICAQSTHKTLGSLTGSSMLHVGNPALLPKVTQAVNLLKSTSPSLILLAVLDEVRAVLARQGETYLARLMDLTQSTRRSLGQIKGLTLLPLSRQGDPTKLVLSFKELGLTGFALEDILRKEYTIQVEFSDYNYVLCLLTIGDTKDTVDRLLFALEDLAFRYRDEKPVHKTFPSYPPLPTMRYLPRESFYLPAELVPLSESRSRVSFGTLTPYPPGVPLVVPGEIISKEVLDYVQEGQKAGISLRGLFEEKVWVIKD